MSPSARPTDFTLTGAGRLRLYSTEELMAMPPPKWLVEGLIPERSFSVLFGPSGVGKSFVAIDLALSVASGLHWAGRSTKPGFVVYVSAEGTAGLGQRIKAWMIDRGLEPADVDIAWLPEAVSMHSDEDLLALFNRFEELQRDPTLIIIDTLARCFDGDENSTEDMGKFVKGVDKIRSRFQCSVMAVHHTSIEGGRERGNGSLRAASDTMVRLLPGILGERAGTKYRQLLCEFSMLADKQKDAPPGPVGLGRLRHVEGTTSGVVDIEWREMDL